METDYNKREKPGNRLHLLLKDHLREILRRESENQTFIYLYCTGPYWVAFEKSAYQLHLMIPDSMVMPMRLTIYPFPVVMVSVTAEELRASRRHLPLSGNGDFRKLTVSSLSLSGYWEWHKEEVGGLPVIQYENSEI